MEVLGGVEPGDVVVWAGGELVEERRRPLSDVEEEAGSVVVVLLLLLGRLLVLDDELESDLVTLPLRDGELVSSVVVGMEVDEVVTGGGVVVVVVVVEAEVVLVDLLLPFPLVTDEETDSVLLLLLLEEGVAPEVLEAVVDVVLLLWPVDDSPGASLVVSVEVVPDVLPRDVVVSAGDVLVDPLERDDEV